MSSSESRTRLIPAFLANRDSIAVALMLFILISFTSKSLYNYPVGILAIAGLGMSLKSFDKFWRMPLAPAFVFLFLCLWLPLLISLVDAVNIERSARTVLSYTRFLFAGLVILYLLRSEKALEKFNLLLFIAITAWCIDALIQYFLSYNLLGFPKRVGYVTGIFHPEITIGHITAVLSPLYFESLRKYSEGREWMWLLVLLVFAVVLLSGRRASWVILAVGSVAYLLYYLKLQNFKEAALKNAALLSVITALIIFTVIATNPILKMRINAAMNLASGNYELANQGIGKRLDIWDTSINIYRENKINGIGPRGFRYAYSDYSEDDNYFHASGQTHPHQLMLEVLAETGTIGAVGVLIFTLFLPFYFWRQGLLMHVAPNMIAILAAVFPINTHMAFYGSYWSSVFWWLMILAFVTATIRLKSSDL